MGSVGRRRAGYTPWLRPLPPLLRLLQPLLRHASQVRSQDMLRVGRMVRWFRWWLGAYQASIKQAGIPTSCCWSRDPPSRDRLPWSHLAKTRIFPLFPAVLPAVKCPGCQGLLTMGDVQQRAPQAYDAWQQAAGGIQIALAQPSWPPSSRVRLPEQDMGPRFDMPGFPCMFLWPPWPPTCMQARRTEGTMGGRSNCHCLFVPPLLRVMVGLGEGWQ